MTSPDDRAPSRTLLVVVSCGAGLLVIGWCAAAILMSNRGLDVTDEGFYLLSYRWWDVDLRTFTGVQYIYGPVFDLLGHSVSGLRVFRLVTVVVAHAVFGWSYMTWLRTRRPDANPSRLWETAGILTILASGGITYGWLPLSPGYNDVAMLSTLLAAAAVLRSVRAVGVGRALPVLPAVALGPLAVMLVLVKWSSAVMALTLLAVFAVAAFRSLGAVGWWRYAGAALASALVSAAFVNFVIMPFSSMVPPMVAVNRIVAEQSNSPAYLLRYYAVQGRVMLDQSLPIVAVGLAIGGLGRVVLGRGRKRIGVTVMVLGPLVALVVAWPSAAGSAPGGVSRLPAYSATLAALALIVAAALVARAAVKWRIRHRDATTTMPNGVDRHWTRWRPTAEHLVVVMLFLLPIAQALGSGNPLQYLAVNEYACWVALFVGAVTALPPTSSSRAFASSATACAVLLAAVTGVGGLMVNPYRASSYTASKVAIGGDGTGSSLLVPEASARYFARLRSVVGADATPGRPMMVFSGGAGFVLVLGGRSVGEGWYGDPFRSGAGIRAACRSGNPWPEDGQPIAVFSRRIVKADRKALRSCGLRLDVDYRLAGPVDGNYGRRMVYLPDPTTRPTTR